MKITLTNAEIYQLTDILKKNMVGDNTYIPVIFNFYIQKNIKKLYTLREEIENCRSQILSHYGVWNMDKTQLTVPVDKVAIV